MRKNIHDDLEVQADEGLTLLHPEITQDRLSSSREWLNHHKGLALAMGGTALTSLGIIYSHNHHNPHPA